VVLCPPLGMEALCVYFTYRVLAERLAEAGIAVVRFDYDGTGDSAGDGEDPGRVEAWERSVSEAVDLATGLGAPHFGLVGVRMGALLGAAELARRGDAEALVLWDPCPSGRSFLREQRAFRMVSVGGEDVGGEVQTPGLRFDAETVADMERLDLSGIEGPLARRLLVLEHPERVRSNRLARRLEAAGAEWTEAVGQADLLDPPQQRPAYASIDRIVAWLDEAFAAAPLPVAAPAGRSAADLSKAGHPCTERAVEVPPAGLFGVVTEPLDTLRKPEAPTVVFVDEGNTPHIGQSRMWVDLARSWAELGYRSIRFDLSGNGDSPPRPGQDRHEARSPEAVEDVMDVARAVAPPDGAGVVLVGLCAGAYQAMEVALEHRVRAILLINPSVTFTPIERHRPDRRGPRRAVQRSKPWFVRLVGGPLRWLVSRRAPQRADEWISALETGSWALAVARRQPWIPDVLWAAVQRLFLDNTPAASFQRIVARGAEVLVVCGPADLAAVSLGAAGRLRRLQAGGNFVLDVVKKIDHAALLVEARRELKAALTQLLTRL